jgi:hypothetical protein
MNTEMRNRISDWDEMEARSVIAYAVSVCKGDG